MIIGILLVTIIAIVSITSLSYYIVSQSNENPNLPSPTPTPTSTPAFTPAPTNETSYTYIVYEWYLKAEYINNVTWLNWSMAGATQGDQILRTSYDSDKTWSENYITYIKSRKAIPEEIAYSGMGVLAKGAFVLQVSVNASFNEATGFTKALYKYGEDLVYSIDSVLPIIADDRGWTKTFV